MRCAAPPPGFE